MCTSLVVYHKSFFPSRHKWGLLLQVYVIQIFCTWLSMSAMTYDIHTSNTYSPSLVAQNWCRDSKTLLSLCVIIIPSYYRYIDLAEDCLTFNSKGGWTEICFFDGQKELWMPYGISNSFVVLGHSWTRCCLKCYQGLCFFKLTVSWYIFITRLRWMVAKIPHVSLVPRSRFLSFSKRNIDWISKNS